jgi:thioesterase domain-containing protein
MYEVAQRLLRSGETVATLIMLDPPDFCFPFLHREIEWVSRVLRLDSRRRIKLTDLVMESIFRWKSEGLASMAGYIGRRALRFPLNRLRRAPSTPEQEPSGGGVNLNFHYVGLITAYNVLPYLGSNPVTMLLRRDDTFRHPRQMSCWRRLVPKVTFDVVVGTHLDFRSSLDDVARCIRQALEVTSEKPI